MHNLGEILIVILIREYKHYEYENASRSLPNQSEHSVALFWVQKIICTGPALTPL